MNDETHGNVLKVERPSLMWAKDIAAKRQEGWILLAFAWDAGFLRFIYYFAKATYFPVKSGTTKN